MNDYMHGLLTDEANIVEERACGACGVGGCDCDYDDLNGDWPEDYE